MPLTRNFIDTVKDRAQSDPDFRVGLLEEAMACFLRGETLEGKLLLRDYINATVGFEQLGADIDRSPKSLMRMLSKSGNPRADNLFSIVAHLQAKEGVSLSVTRSQG